MTHLEDGGARVPWIDMHQGEEDVVQPEHPKQHAQPRVLEEDDRWMQKKKVGARDNM
jgi:hypothetical protein